MDADEKKIIELLLKRVNLEIKDLPDWDSQRQQENGEALVEALENNQIIIREKYEENREPNSIAHAQIGNYYFSMSSITNISSLNIDVAAIIASWAFFQSDVRPELLSIGLTKLVKAVSHLSENEREVLHQFRSQAVKQRQPLYKAVMHYHDLAKGFDPEGTIPFDATLNSLLSKGILIKQDEDIYRLVR